MLDLARAIVEKHSVADTMEKVDILSTLAEVSLERGQFICLSFIFLFVFYDFCWMKNFRMVLLALHCLFWESHLSQKCFLPLFASFRGY